MIRESSPEMGKSFFLYTLDFREKHYFITRSGTVMGFKKDKWRLYCL